MPKLCAYVDSDELIANTDPTELERYQTVYDGNCGGHYPVQEVPPAGQ
ncbi:hypothetical protein ABT124_29785 [Streptomyces sp. NPDC001982]